VRRITREQEYTTKPLDIIGGPNDGHIEDPEMSGELAAAPALSIDRIVSHDELFYFQGRVCKFVRGTRISDDLNSDALRLQS
jgi:hypothetical protein